MGREMEKNKKRKENTETDKGQKGGRERKNSRNKCTERENKIHQISTTPRIGRRKEDSGRHRGKRKRDG